MNRDGPRPEVARQVSIGGPMSRAPKNYDLLAALQEIVALCGDAPALAAIRNVAQRALGTVPACRRPRTEGRPRPDPDPLA